MGIQGWWRPFTEWNCSDEYGHTNGEGDVVTEFGPGGMGAEFDGFELGGPVFGEKDLVGVVGAIFVVPGRVDGGEEEEERFLSAHADTFAGAKVKEKTSACCARNDGVWVGPCVER